MSIKVLLFARAREAYGKSQTSVEFDGVPTPSTCFARMCADAPGLEALRPNLLVAVNENYASWDQPLEPGDEVAFIPPVSGG